MSTATDDRARQDRENVLIQNQLDNVVEDAKHQQHLFRTVLTWLIIGQVVGLSMIMASALFNGWYLIPDGANGAIITVGALAAVVCFGWTIYWVVEEHHDQHYAKDLMSAERELKRFLLDPDGYPRSRR